MRRALARHLQGLHIELGMGGHLVVFLNNYEQRHLQEIFLDLRSYIADNKDENKKQAYFLIYYCSATLNED